MPVTNEFNNLPLTQVDLKVTLPEPFVFDPLGLLTSADSMSGHYNTVQSDHGMEMPPGVNMMPELPNSVQFVRFVDPNRSVSATLHMQMAAVRWADYGRGHDYPRYKELREELNWVITNWPVTKNVTTFPVAQIMYQNFIVKEDRPDFLWFLNPEIVRFDVPGLKVVADYQLGFSIEKADARIAITSATRTTDGVERTGLLLQTVVGTLEPLGTWDAMMDFCHDESNKLFESILSKEAKEKWEHKKQ